MKHVGIERPAKVPASAVQHWSGHGWVETDPPPRRTYTRPTDATVEQAMEAAAAALNAPAPPVESTPVDATQDTVDDKPTKPRKAPSGRKED